MGGTKAPEDLLRKIRQGNRFLLTSHANPDGDAIGSELGLARLLRGLGKGAVIWNHDPTPTVYKALPGSDRIHVGEEPPAGFPEKFDAIIVLECPSPDRTGLEKHLAERPVINIDHHLGNQCYGTVNWVDSAAPAVGEVVFFNGLTSTAGPTTRNTSRGSSGSIVRLAATNASASEHSASTTANRAMVSTPRTRCPARC